MEAATCQVPQESTELEALIPHTSLCCRCCCFGAHEMPVALRTTQMLLTILLLVLHLQLTRKALHVSSVHCYTYKMTQHSKIY